MAKIYGLFGSMKGKVADVVMAVRNGEQIVRKYQPIVSNPKSAAQLETRAKLKLLSQLSSVLAPVIAMRRVGSVSSRNRFTKENFKLAQFENNTATISLPFVQLTSSAVGLPPVFYAGSEAGISVYLASSAGGGAGEPIEGGYDSVVYVMLIKGSDEKLRLVATRVVTEPGSNNTYAATFPGTNYETVFLAYGIRNNTEAARVAFGNLTAQTGEQVASLLVSSVLLESDVTVTETRGTTRPAVTAANPNVVPELKPETKGKKLPK